MITWHFLPSPSRDDRRVWVAHPGGITTLVVENCSIGAKLHLESGPALDEADADDLRHEINMRDAKEAA